MLQPYFKSNEGISQTSLCRGVLNKINRQFFSCDLLNARKWRNYYWGATYKDNFITRPQPRILFLVHEWWFSQETLLIWVLAPMPLFLQGNHMQKQYLKRTTLIRKSSTIVKWLLYTPDHDKRKKGPLSDQPRLFHVTPTVLLCCWGRSCSKIWHPSWLTLRCN